VRLSWFVFSPKLTLEHGLKYKWLILEGIPGNVSEEVLKQHREGKH
jgi:hypothetical protein